MLCVSYTHTTVRTRHPYFYYTYRLHVCDSHKVEYTQVYKRTAIVW
jgi:hypothetical protein